MNDQNKLKKTPLHDWHCTHHANMAEFGGYHMPLWYSTGAKTEHLSVINGAGIFDTSHMAVVMVNGDNGFDLLQHCFSKDLNCCIGKKRGRLTPGRSVYGVFLKEDGTVLDDAIVSLLDSGAFMVVVNSGMGETVSRYLEKYCDSGIRIEDFSDKIGKIDIQGPASALIVEKLFADPDDVLTDMIYFSFRGNIFPEGSPSVVTRDGISVLVSRTGYTGEFGFELFTDSSNIAQLWETVLAIGQDYDLCACGLAARDSLRAGALLPLSHQDIGDWVFGDTPWSFVLPWAEDGVSFSKSFIGMNEVIAARGSSYTYGFAGYDPRKITVTETTRVLDVHMNCIGRVLTCTTDMAIGRHGKNIVSVATPESQGRPVDFTARGLSCGFIMTDRPCQVGDTVFLSEGKRNIKVEVRDDVRPDRTARRPMQQMRKRT